MKSAVKLLLMMSGAIAPPGAVTNLAITGASGGTVADLTPEATADATPGALTYDFEIALTSVGLTGTPTVTGQATPAYTFSTLLNFTSYDIGIRAVNAAGAGPWTTITVQTAVYLLNDSAPVDDAAPIATPVNAIPGPGIRKLLADTGNDIAASGGDYIITDPGGSWTASVLQWADTGDVGWTRATGLCFAIDVTPNHASAKFILGWDGTDSANYPKDQGFYLNGALVLSCDSGEKAAQNLLIMTVGQTYTLYMRLRTSGADYYVKPPSSDVYLHWSASTSLDPGGSATRATLKVKISENNQQCTFSNPRIMQLSGDLATDDGVAALNVASPTETEYTGLADQLLDLTLTAPGSITEEAGIIFRKGDANNYWRAYFATDGAFKVDKVTSGTPSTQINVAGVIVAGGTRTIRMVMAGSKITAYTFNAGAPLLRGSTLTDSHQSTATTCEPDIGASWTAANLISRPHTSALYAPLELA